MRCVECCGNIFDIHSCGYLGSKFSGADLRKTKFEAPDDTRTDFGKATSGNTFTTTWLICTCHLQVGLNNVELSCENVVRLKSDVEGMASKIFQNNPQDLQKIGAILDEMLQAEKKLRNVLQVLSKLFF